MVRGICCYLMVVIFAGCASQSHVIVGTVRAPVSSDQVKLYLSPPKRYEQVALLDASVIPPFSVGLTSRSMRPWPTAVSV